MIALLTRWRLVAAGGAMLAAALLLSLLQRERHARAEAEAGRDQAWSELSAVRSQGELDRTAGAAAAAVQARTVHIVTRSEEAAHAIHDLPGAEQALPDAVRGAWADGVRRLREPPATASGADRAGG